MTTTALLNSDNWTVYKEIPHEQCGCTGDSDHRAWTILTQQGSENDLFHALVYLDTPEEPTKYSDKQDLFADLDSEQDDPVALLGEGLRRGQPVEWLMYYIIAPNFSQFFTEGQYWTMKYAYDAWEAYGLDTAYDVTPEPVDDMVLDDAIERLMDDDFPF